MTAVWHLFTALPLWGQVVLAQLALLAATLFIGRALFILGRSPESADFAAMRTTNELRSRQIVAPTPLPQARSSYSRHLGAVK